MVRNSSSARGRTVSHDSVGRGEPFRGVVDSRCGQRSISIVGDEERIEVPTQGTGDATLDATRLARVLRHTRASPYIALGGEVRRTSSLRKPRSRGRPRFEARQGWRWIVNLAIAAVEQVFHRGSPYFTEPPNGQADQLRATAATVLRCAPASAARNLPCPSKHAVARQLHSLVRRRLFEGRSARR